MEKGVKVVWIINPMEQEIEIHGQNDSKKSNKDRGEESLVSIVLPNMYFLPKWLWEKEQYPASSIVEQIFKKRIYFYLKSKVHLNSSMNQISCFFQIKKYKSPTYIILNFFDIIKIL